MNRFRNSVRGPAICSGILFGLLLLRMSASAQTVYSTATGGAWTSAATWEGGVLPVPANDVVIRATATVTLNVNPTIHDLTVEGVLENISGSNVRILTVSSSLANEGTIRNGFGSMVINIAGDLSFTGTEMSNNTTSLTGSSVQHIAFGNGCLYRGSLFSANAPARDILSSTDLHFYGTTIGFNGGSLVLPADGVFSLSGGGNQKILSNINLLTSSGTFTLRLENGAEIRTATVAGAILGGEVRIGDSNVDFTGNTTLGQEDTLTSSGTSARTLDILGSIVNNGVIRNGPGSLNVNISGNMTDLGEWSGNTTTLTGTSSQDVFFGDGVVFTGASFTVDYFAGKIVHSGSDLAFDGTNIDFGYPPVVLSMADRKKIIVSGNGKKINHAILEGNEIDLIMTGGSYFQNLTSNVNGLRLKGFVQNGDNNSVFNGPVLVMDSLVNYGIGHFITFNGDLTNLGYIYDGQGQFETRIGGSMVHRGVLWANYKVTLQGSIPQTLDFAPGNSFSGLYLSKTTGTALNAASPLIFENTAVTLNNVSVTFPDGALLSLSNTGCSLGNATVGGNISMMVQNGAFIRDLTFNGEVTLGGEVNIYNNNVVFNGPVTNTGVLRNQNLTGHTLNVHGILLNRGSIENGAGLGNLTLNIQGDVFNFGTWTNYETTLTGAGDQHIRLANGQPVNGTVKLQSNLGGNGYQWYKDNTLIQGATSPILSMPLAGPAQYGLYYCTSSAGQSRLFTINSRAVADFISDVNDGCSPLTVNFTDMSQVSSPVQSWDWDFGDGATGSGPNPAHQ